MKPAKGLVFITVFLLATAFTGADVVFSGKVFTNQPEIAKCIMLVKVVARKGGRILSVGHDLLDTTGVYKLDVKSTSTPVDIYIAGLGVDTMYVKTYSSFSSSNIPLDIEIPNVYKKDDAGNVLCPKCGSGDDILPIHYSTHHRIKRVIHNGDTTYVPLDHNIPSVMYSELHPYWYCNKCKIQF